MREKISRRTRDLSSWKITGMRYILWCVYIYVCVYVHGATQLAVCHVNLPLTNIQAPYRVRKDVRNFATEIHAEESSNDDRGKNEDNNRS